MYQGRILVVDDLPDWRVTLSGLLSDAGYAVRSVSSRSEALQLLETERFHIAVLDARLDESDEENQEGLDLMRALKQRDPATAAIIFTGHATVKMVQNALQPMESGADSAFAFLEKTENDRLIPFVRRAFDEELKLNFDLEIVDDAQALPRLPKQIRFVNTAKPARESLLDQAEEILRRLFFDYARVELHLMHRGFSGVAVLQVIPWYRDQSRGEAVIVKIGDYTLVEKEYAQFHDLVQGRVGGHRLPKTLGLARTRSIAGLVYTFAGLGASVDFATFYEKSETAVIAQVIDNLFIETCFPWRRDSATRVAQQDLRAVYLPLLRLTPKKLQDSLNQTIGGRHPFRRDARGSLWLDSETELIDPVAFALSADLRADSCIGTIHGDLQGYNVLVDHRAETWLIDFASANTGPLLHDYAMFETFLRISLIKMLDWRVVYRWEKNLFASPDIRDATLSNEFADNAELVKAHRAIARVRHLAMTDPTAETKPYLIALLFNALKLATVMDLPNAERDHALIAAAVIAERLSQRVSGEM